MESKESDTLFLSASVRLPVQLDVRRIFRKGHDTVVVLLVVVSQDPSTNLHAWWGRREPLHERGHSIERV